MSNVSLVTCSCGSWHSVSHMTIIRTLSVSYCCHIKRNEQKVARMSARWQQKPPRLGCRAEWPVGQEQPGQLATESKEGPSGGPPRTKREPTCGSREVRRSQRGPLRTNRYLVATCSGRPGSPLHEDKSALNFRDIVSIRNMVTLCVLPQWSLLYDFIKWYA